MSFLNGIVAWTKEIFLPLGPFGLFLLAFMESSFFPVPPDVLLIILCLAEPSSSLLFALLCTLGSVLGAIFGYYIGKYFGRPVLTLMFKEEKIDKVHRLFQKYEAWAIFIAGFTPIPYKLFTIAGGVFEINMRNFIIASTLSRGLRFFIIAGFLLFFGEMIVDFINNYLGLASIAFVIVLISAYYGFQYLKKKKYFDHFFD